MRQMMLNADAGQGVVAGGNISHSSQSDLALNKNSLLPNSHCQSPSQLTATHGNTNGRYYRKSLSCGNYSSSMRSDGISSRYSQDKSNDGWPEFRGSSSSRGSGGGDKNSGRSLLRHSTTNFNGESSRHGITIKTNNTIRKNDAGGSSGEKQPGVINIDSRDPDLDLQSDSNNGNNKVCRDHHHPHYRRASMPIYIGANQVNKHNSHQDKQRLNNNINSTSKFMAEFIELKMEVAQLRSELQVAQFKVTAQQKSMQEKNDELSKRNAALKEENQFYLKLVSANRLEQQRSVGKLEGTMGYNDDNTELLQLQSLFGSGNKETQSTTTTSAASESLRIDHSWKKSGLDWGSAQGGGSNDRIALVSTTKIDGNAIGEQQQQQKVKSKRNNSWWSMRRSSSLEEVDLLVDDNNNNSNARSNDGHDSENRECHANNTVLAFGATSTANTNDAIVATDNNSSAKRVGDVIDLPPNDNAASTATICTPNQSSLGNGDGNGELKKSSSLHASFFDMDDDQQQHQQKKPSSWTSSWIRQTSDGKTTSSSQAKELQQRRQHQHQRRNSFVETIKSIPRTIPMPRIIHDVFAEVGVAQTETTDDEHHVEPRQMNLQRQPSRLQQHRSLRQQQQQQHHQHHQDGEDNDISNGNDEITRVPEVVLFLGNGEGDLRCSDITHDAKGMEANLARR